MVFEIIKLAEGGFSYYTNDYIVSRLRNQTSGSTTASDDAFLKT